ncbi:hypothetical protein [Desulfogranum japonicum]|uniref:hypothetical protein n=1 Tax=Desulfogranum japonicum TaxID=231447 RepID=UPI00041CF36A|nr:hypothetical protein [Desulfogranum japonicum]
MGEDIVSVLGKALLLKQKISTDRFVVEGLPDIQAACPTQCHECCRSNVKMDLTGLEALLVFLLNRDMIELVMEHHALTGDTGFCPFLVSDSCIIHAYKPTACQMFMPYLYQGKATCAYRLNGLHASCLEELRVEQYLNSYSYDIHGYLMLCQVEIDEPLIPRSFSHIFDGVVYWSEHYQLLPAETRTHMETILDGQAESLNKYVSSFDFALALSQGHGYYLAAFENACCLEHK